jgi:hypothetical protein
MKTTQTNDTVSQWLTHVEANETVSLVKIIISVMDRLSWARFDVTGRREMLHNNQADRSRVGCTTLCWGNLLSKLDRSKTNPLPAQWLVPLRLSEEVFQLCLSAIKSKRLKWRKQTSPASQHSAANLDVSKAVNNCNANINSVTHPRFHLPVWGAFEMEISRKMNGLLESWLSLSFPSCFTVLRSRREFYRLCF